MDFTGKILAIVAILSLVLPVSAVTLAQIQQEVVYPLNITYVNGGVGPQGATGPQGVNGTQGPQGIPGANGSATVTINNTFTTSGNPSVVNVGTSTAAVLDFYLPSGGSVNLSALYPVYSVIMTATGQNPASTIGFGNWTLVGG